MRSIENVLVQQTHLDIFSCARQTSVDLKGWIANQRYFLDQDLTPTEFTMRSSDASYLKAALANDCNRMAMATIESVSGLGRDRGLARSGAWGVIRTYYSAFYAAHCLLRLFGVSCSYLEKAHVNKILELADAFGRRGNTTSLDQGFYEIRIDRQFANVSLRKFRDSHADTWAAFLGLLERLIEESEGVSARMAQKIEVIEMLLAIKAGITRSNCRGRGNWLSIIRNSVNYQHSHGMWYPYERRGTAPAQICKVRDNWPKPLSKIEPDHIKDDITAFFEVCLLINALLRELIVACAGRASSQNSAIRNGCLKLVNLLAISTETTAEPSAEAN